MSLRSVLFKSEDILSQFFCIESKEISFKRLTAIPNHAAGLNIKRHFTYIHIGLVSKAGRKMHKAIHVGKVRYQAN
jgi:hypothetical protein